MPIEAPEPGSLARIAMEGCLGIDDADLPVYQGAMQGLLQSWTTVEKLYAGLAASIPKRSWSRPDDAHNRLGAWYVQVDLREGDGGPLAGRTVAIKDNISVAGVPMANGSRCVDGYLPAEDATVVRWLLEAGATIAGKSTCEDMCFSGGSHTSKPGPVRNPWDPARSAGGSSSGSAALVAAGEVDLALGGDQGGSVRIPASFCGVVGHKPTFGLVPYTGAFPIEQSIDHLGPMTRTVADAAVMLDVLAGVDGMDPRQPDFISPTDHRAALEEPITGIRVGVLQEGFGLANSEPEVDESVRRAIESLCSVGASAEDVSVPWHAHGSSIWDVISVEGATYQMIDGNGYGLNWKGFYDPELIAHYGAKWRTDPSQFSETVKLVALAGRHVLATQYGRHYAMARRLEASLTEAYDRALADHDVLVMPTLPIRASELPNADAPVAEILDRGLEMLANTAPFDVTGHPACSVPAGVVDGLPVGLMIVGKRFDDATVLRVAHALESAVGGFQRPDVRQSDA